MKHMCDACVEHDQHMLFKRGNSQPRRLVQACLTGGTPICVPELYTTDHPQLDSLNKEAHA